MHFKIRILDLAIFVSTLDPMWLIFLPRRTTTRYFFLSKMKTRPSVHSFHTSWQGHPPRLEWKCRLVTFCSFSSCELRAVSCFLSPSSSAAVVVNSSAAPPLLGNSHYVRKKQQQKARKKKEKYEKMTFDF